MKLRRRLALILFWLPLLLPGLAFASTLSVEHPFILWDAAEIAALRNRADDDASFRARIDALSSGDSEPRVLVNLFRHLVLDDSKAAKVEKEYLLGIIGTHPRDYERRLGYGGRHFDCSWDALRYDVLHPLLSDDERSRLEDTFRAYVEYLLQDQKTYTRTSWLPNMQWPRPLTAHFMALVLRDRALLGRIIESNGGWKWYLDEYLSPEGFYMEEFGKHYATIGQMLLFCEGLRRAGLDHLGYGYTGKGGATVLKYLQSIHLATYPATDIPGGRPQFAKITMGDARGTSLTGAPPHLFQHALVTGHLRDGSGGDRRWTAMNMNGRDHRLAKVPKLAAPHWLELSHRRWPEAGFGGFLAAIRSPAQTSYVPSVFWGLEPIDPASATFPAAPSYVSAARGLAFLRAEEGPAYWNSPAPAVAFQLANYYVHSTRDAFSLLGFHAFNRPLYLNRGIHDGYAGGDPWTDSLRGHSGLVVDNQPGEFVGQIPTRHLFAPGVKIVVASDDPALSGGRIRDADDREIAHTRGVFGDVFQTRALFLTREYLFDVTRLRAPRPVIADWQVHAIGRPRIDAAWMPAHDFGIEQLYVGPHNADFAARHARNPAEAPANDAERRLARVRADGDRFALRQPLLLANHRLVDLGVEQSCATGDPAASVMGPDWYERRVGVRVRVLAAPGESAYLGGTPRYQHLAEREQGKSERSTLPDEVDGITLIVRRKTDDSTFVALHEPFEHGAPRPTRFQTLASTAEGLAAEVSDNTGAFRDLLLLRHDRAPEEALRLVAGKEFFEFRGFAHLRITADHVDASGQLTGLRVSVAGRPALRINGRTASAQITADGHLEWTPASEPSTPLAR